MVSKKNRGPCRFEGEEIDIEKILTLAVNAMEISITGMLGLAAIRSYRDLLEKEMIREQLKQISKKGYGARRYGRGMEGMMALPQKPEPYLGDLVYNDGDLVYNELGHELLPTTTTINNPAGEELRIERKWEGIAHLQEVRDVGVYFLPANTLRHVDIVGHELLPTTNTINNPAGEELLIERKWEGTAHPQNSTYFVDQQYEGKKESKKEEKE